MGAVIGIVVAAVVVIGGIVLFMVNPPVPKTPEAAGGGGPVQAGPGAQAPFGDNPRDPGSSGK